MENERLDWATFEGMFGDWGRYFKDFFTSKKAWDIYQRLKEDSKKGAKIFPSSNNTYKAFKDCPPDKLQVILYGSDPYVGKYKDGKPQATGLALDCSNSPDGKCQPSLVAFWQGIAKEYGEEPEMAADLSFLPAQGVLLTNRALTAEYQKIGKHGDWWDDFQEYFLTEVIQPFFPGIPIVFMGKEAAKLQKWVFPLSNPSFVVEHPSYASRSGQDWDTKQVFHKVNQIIKQNNGEAYMIEWNKRNFDKLISEVPF
jgi:uracil-DNA glycosylase